MRNIHCSAQLTVMRMLYSSLYYLINFTERCIRKEFSLQKISFSIKYAYLFTFMRCTFIVEDYHSQHHNFIFLLFLLLNITEMGNVKITMVYVVGRGLC